MSDPAMWSRAKQVATYIVREWMLLEADRRTMDKLVEEIELELDKAFDDGMRAVAGISQPLIRAAALEEAAQVAEGQRFYTSGSGFQLTANIAAAIRALKSATPPPSADSA